MVSSHKMFKKNVNWLKNYFFFGIQQRRIIKIIIQTTIIQNAFAAAHDWYSSSHLTNYCHSLPSNHDYNRWREGAYLYLAADKLDNFEWFVARPCTKYRLWACLASYVPFSYFETCIKEREKKLSVRNHFNW